MEPVRVEAVAAITTSVSKYGSQLASVFHNYALVAERPPRGLEGAINILDATVVQLKHILTLLRDESGNIENDGKKRLFSDEGLQYVRLLTLESAATLAKIEPTIVKATADQKYSKPKGRRPGKLVVNKENYAVNIESMKLNETAFLDKVEKLRWRYVESSFDDVMERLHDLQLHFLLLFQVVTLGTLSRDL